jgi:hypothetical protein
MICGYKNVPREDNKLAGIYGISLDRIQSNSDRIPSLPRSTFSTVPSEESFTQHQYGEILT